MKETLLQQIKEKFSKNELFTLDEIVPKGKNKQLIKEELNVLVKKKKISRYSYGLYYLNDAKNIIEIDSTEAIIKRYICNKNDVYGFFTGENFISYNLTNNIRKNSKIEIISNHATSGKKEVYMFKKRFILRKPYFQVNKDNYYLNQFLSYIAMESLETINNNYSFLANYIRKYHLSASEVNECIVYFPSKVYTKLLASTLYKSLWKH